MNWTAIISAVVSVGAAVSIAAGQPVLAAVISDPHTATALTALIGVAGSVVSALSPAVHKPATPAS